MAETLEAVTEWQAGTLPPIEDPAAVKTSLRGFLVTSFKRRSKEPPPTPDVTKDKKKPQGRPASTGAVMAAPVPPPGWEAEGKRQVQEQLGSCFADFQAVSSFFPLEIQSTCAYISSRLYHICHISIYVTLANSIRKGIVPSKDVVWCGQLLDLRLTEPEAP